MRALVPALLLSVFPVLGQGGDLLLLRKPADTSTLEDTPLSLFIGDVFQDPMGKPIVYSASVDPTQGEVSIAGGTLTFRPRPDFFQSGFYIFLTGLAEGTRKGSARFAMTVHPVNDPPRIADTMPPLAFHNNDSFQVNLQKYVADAEDSHNLWLRWDSLPGFEIRAQGMWLTGCAPGSISPSTLRIRVQDPNGAVSAPAGLRLEPNLPAQGSILPLSPLRAGNLSGASVFPVQDGLFEVLAFTSRRAYLDRYRMDGSKARPAVVRAFPPGDTLRSAGAVNIGDGYLIFLLQGATDLFSLWYADAGLESVRRIEPPGLSRPGWKGVDRDRRVVYLQWQQGNAPVLKAYDFAMSPLPDPPFSDWVVDGKEMAFAGNRILLFPPRFEGNPLAVPVKAYARDGWSFLDSTSIRPGHVPAREGMLSEIVGIRLIPEGSRFLLLASIWDYTFQPGKSLHVDDTRLIYQPLGEDLRPLDSTRSFPKPEQPAPMPMVIHDLRVAGSVVVLWAPAARDYDLDPILYAQAFDPELKPRLGPETFIGRKEDGYRVQHFVPLAGNQYLEARKFQDGRIQGLIRSAGPSVGFGTHRPAVSAGGRSSRLHRSGSALFAVPSDGSAPSDIAGRRKAAKPIKLPR